MGKTYKDYDDRDDADELFEDHAFDDLEFDGDMDMYLSRQLSKGPSKRHKSRRGESQDPIGNLHRLPRDWQDFDYASDQLPGDDWR